MGAKVLMLFDVPHGRSGCAFDVSFVADRIFGVEISARSARV